MEKERKGEKDKELLQKLKKKRKRKKIKEKQGKLPGKNKRTGRITRGKRGVYNRAKDDFVEHRERERETMDGG